MRVVGGLWLVVMMVVAVISVTYPVGFGPFGCKFLPYPSTHHPSYKIIRGKAGQGRG